MHILTGLLLFLIGAIGAACKGDWSGISAILWVIGGFFFLYVLLMYPAATIGIIIAIRFIIFAFTRK